MSVHSAERKLSLWTNIAGAFVAGCVFALHWPGYLIPAFLFGALAGRKLLVPGPRGFLISLAYAALCIFYHMTVYNYPYSLLMQLNPAYFRFGIFLILPVFIFWKKDIAAWGPVIIFAALIPGIFTVKLDNVMSVALMLCFAVLAFRSGELNRLCFVPLCLAAFHCFIYTGLFTYTGSAPQLSGKITASELSKYDFPGITEEYAPLHLDIAGAVKDPGKTIGRGAVRKAIADTAGSEIFILAMRKSESHIVVIDSNSKAVKRSSFSKSCGGNETDFDLSEDGRFIVCTSGDEVNLLDTAVLELRDTLALPEIRGRTRVKFGPEGTLYLSVMSGGYVIELKYDKYGHGLSRARTMVLTPGILPLAYMAKEHFLAAGNNMTGSVFVIDPDTMTLIGEKEIVPNLKMDDVYTDREYILFRTVVDGVAVTIKTEPIDLMNWEQPESIERLHGLASFLVMPVKLFRSTR